MNEIFSHYRLIAISIWLLAVTASWTWNTIDDFREKNSIAQVTARAFFEQIVASRDWNLMHGGVYVYTTHSSPPNPYLPKEKRYIRDENGTRLTLINPSYMTRQIAEISKKKGQVEFHITSLNTLRPENAPYPWEKPWLEAFNNGSLEESGFTKIDGKTIYRYMAPLFHRQSCLSCHPPPNQVNETVRGAISLSIPIPFQKSPWPLFLSHLFVAITGIIGILFFGQRLAGSRRKIIKSKNQLELEVEERKQTEKELLSIKNNLEAIVKKRTTELLKINNVLDNKIKEQQKIETSLVAINDEFIQIFNSAPDGMRVIDRNFNVIRANHAYCKITKKPIKEIQGKKCYQTLSGKPCHTIHCPLTRIIRGEKRVELEVLKIRTDGTEVPCIVTATPFRKPDGERTGIIEVTRDISSWKEIEKSLSATAERLKRRNMELEDFAHVISHDLQEPLMLIQVFSDRIRKKYTDVLPKKGISYLEQIEKSSCRMQNLIDGLLSYSRVSRKNTPFELVKLHATIDSVLDDLAVKIEQTHAAIHIDNNLGTLEADPLQLRQLFQNIISNSLKYHHHDRPPEITIKRIPFLEQEKQQTHIRFSVEDNGIGFKNENSDVIFDIFQRLHTRRKLQGTGIGLSICKKIVERHQGSITAEGVPGQGATFVITLPLHQEQCSRENEPSDTLITDSMNRN